MTPSASEFGKNGANPQASDAVHHVVKPSVERVVNLDGENVNTVSATVIREDPGVDTGEAARFISEVFGNTHGHLEVAAFLKDEQRPQCAFRRLGEEITRYNGETYTLTPEKWAEGFERSDRRGIDPQRRPNPSSDDLTPVDAWYIRMTTLAAEPYGFARGGKTNVREFVGFWLDGDYNVPGHHKNDADGGNPLPENADKVFGIWTACGYPEPSVIWHTGGGINALWLLDEPVIFADNDEGRTAIGKAQQASDRWHDRARRTAASMGYHHDSVPNLDRLMRLPGTVNRKVWTEPKPVTAEYTGLRYPLDQLLALIPEPVETEDGTIDPATGEILAPPKPRIPAGRIATGDPAELKPWDDFDQRADWWGDVLSPLGFSHFGWAGGTEYLYRPGKSSGSLSASLNHDGHDKLFVFSSSVESMFKSSEPYSWRYLTKSQVWCHMFHGGDWKACASDLRSRGYGGDFTPVQLASVPKMQAPPVDAVPVMPNVPAPRAEETAEPDDSLFTGEPQDPEGDAPGGPGGPDDGGGQAPRDDNTFSNPDAPMRVARELEHLWQKTDGRTLHHWRDTWMSWTGARFAEVGVSSLKSKLYLRLEHGIYWVPDKHGDLEPKPWNPSMKKIANLVDAIAAVTHLDEKTEPGNWLDGRPGGGLVSCRNVMVNPVTRETVKHTPAYFTTTAVPYDYIADAACPVWLRFLNDVFGDDQEAIDTLQEWMGYVISGRTDLQKGVQLIGPPRAGKGTVARLIEKLIGKENAVGTTLKALGTNFGLQPLIGKSLCVFGDAQMENRNNSEIVARLLMITGEDSITVDRKNRAQWDGKMGARVMILANKPPRFSDASGAIVNRFITLQFTRSFLGKEDPQLENKIQPELPGIFNWALDGLARLNERGYFKQPDSSQDLIENQRQESAPISAFIGERCVIGPQEWITKDALFAHWQNWCYQNNYKNVGTTAALATDLYAAQAGIKKTRRRINGDLTYLFTGITMQVEPGLLPPSNQSHPAPPVVPAQSAEQLEAELS